MASKSQLEGPTMPYERINTYVPGLPQCLARLTRLAIIEALRYGAGTDPKSLTSARHFLSGLAPWYVWDDAEIQRILDTPLRALLANDPPAEESEKV